MYIKKLLVLLISTLLSMILLYLTSQITDKNESKPPFATVHSWYLHTESPEKDWRENYNLKITGSPKFSQDGVTLGAADKITILNKATPTSQNLPKNSISIVAWVKIDERIPWGGIVGCFQDNGAFERGFILGYNKEKFYFGIVGSNTDQPKMTYLESQEKYEAGRWYHVVGTYDSESQKIYINGELSATSTEQKGFILYADAAPYTIGRYQDDDEDFPLIGSLREVHICTICISSEDVKTHFQSNANLAAQKPKVKKQFTILPYIQYPTQTSCTIMAETAMPTECKVEYGTTYPPQQIIKVNGTKQLHEVSLTGLKANTKYFYRVVCTESDGSEIVGPFNVFTTAVHDSDAFSFVVIGDTQRNPEVTGKLAKLMWERRPHFVVHLGDVVDQGPDKKQWTDDLFTPCTDLFSRVAVFPTIGNHEKNHKYYYDYFALPQPEYFYKFKYGNAEFFTVDTNKPINEKNEQYKWLENELHQSKALWKFCYHHHPAWSSDSDDYGDTWKVNSKLGDPRARVLTKLYDKYKVDISFNGHIHLYERSWPITDGKAVENEGTVYITSGGGGGRLEDFAPTPTFFKNQIKVDYHFMYFTVLGKRLEAKVYDVEGRLFDSFTMTK